MGYHNHRVMHFLLLLAPLPHSLLELGCFLGLQGEETHLERERVGWGDRRGHSGEGLSPGSGKGIPCSPVFPSEIN